MSGGPYVPLVDRLRALPRETEWVELERRRYEPREIGEYLSALANSACLAGQPRGYLVFGIDDETHHVVGTRFDPYSAKGRGNQDLLPWLAVELDPHVGFEFPGWQDREPRLEKEACVDASRMRWARVKLEPTKCSGKKKNPSREGSPKSLDPKDLRFY